jgi:predicted SprT family Zn-dependent metalloprotease
MQAQILDQVNRIATLYWQALCRVEPKLIQYRRPQITLNNRFTRTAGCCIVLDNKIELGTKFFQYSAQFHHEMLHIILPHELCHQADYNLYGTPKGNRWHGKSWQNLMLGIGLAPETYHNMDIKR